MAANQQTANPPATFDLDPPPPLTPPPSPPPEAPAFELDQKQFLYKISVATCSVILLYVVLLLLKEYKAILQPLFIAVFLCYMIFPVHRRLVHYGIPARSSYVVILLLILGSLFGLGRLAYTNIEQFQEKLPLYEKRLQSSAHSLAEQFQFDPPDKKILSELSLQGIDMLAVLGSFRDFFAALAVTFIYLVFLIAERMVVPGRVLRAFGDQRGTQILQIVGKINDAISEYLSVKAFISIVAGAFSMAALAIFGVDFYITWGILICLLNFIPYIGSLIAVVPPIALSFLQPELELWQGIAVTVILIGIQQACGVIEPQIAGTKLGVSPLFILLSLAFWGAVWGVVGMILAVPLLMTLKIVLDNIPETKPLAMLLSNR